MPDGAHLYKMRPISTRHYKMGGLGGYLYKMILSLRSWHCVE